MTEDDAVALARALSLAHVGKKRAPRWSHVGMLTSHGSGLSSALCRRFGLDPDEVVGGSDPVTWAQASRLTAATAPAEGGADPLDLVALGGSAERWQAVRDELDRRGLQCIRGFHLGTDQTVPVETVADKTEISLLKVALELAQQRIAELEAATPPMVEAVPYGAVNWPDPHSNDRIVGFRIPAGDPILDGPMVKAMDWLRSVTRATPMVEAGRGVDAEVLLNEYASWIRAIPTGAFDVSKGDSTFNWHSAALRKLRELTAALSGKAGKGDA